MQTDASAAMSKARKRLDLVLYWYKLVTGMVFGFLSYMIMRVSDLTFFLIVPLLLFIALLIALGIVYNYNQKHPTQFTKKMIIKRSLMYTGTYFLAFLALATLSFYWGA
ncbi:MAG: hypothetical protein ACFFE2_11500 [Candidatus Thorarchaeota archaeon]